MTTNPIMSITDEQIAEIEACNVPICADLASALISRLRAAERDAARYRWLREKGFGFSHDDGFAGISISKWGPAWMYDEKEGFAEFADTAIDTAMKGDQQ